MSPDEVEVVLKACPLELFARTRQHNESLMREFAFIAETDDDSNSAPARLLAIVDRLSGRLPRLATQVEDHIASAVARGADTVDLVISVPAGGREIAIELLQVLDDAEEFCRTGDLLTLAEVEEPARFRSWYVGQYVHQLDGGAPVPWPEWRASQA